MVAVAEQMRQDIQREQAAALANYISLLRDPKRSSQKLIAAARVAGLEPSDVDNDLRAIERTRQIAERTAELERRRAGVRERFQPLVAVLEAAARQVKALKLEDNDAVMMARRSEETITKLVTGRAGFDSRQSGINSLASIKEEGFTRGLSELAAELDELKRQYPRAFGDNT